MSIGGLGASGGLGQGVNALLARLSGTQGAAGIDGDGSTAASVPLRPRRLLLRPPPATRSPATRRQPSAIRFWRC